MSFDKFDKEQLKKVVDEFGLLDEPEKASEDELREAVESSKVPDAEIKLSFPEFAELLDEDDEDNDEEDGGLITSENTTAQGRPAKKTAKKAVAKKTAAPSTKSAKTVVPDDVTLIKMTRNNPVYEVRGYRFERTHPFVLVKDEDVDYLIEVEGGFTVAKKSEVESFYN